MIQRTDSEGQYVIRMKASRLSHRLPAISALFTPTSYGVLVNMASTRISPTTRAGATPSLRRGSRLARRTGNRPVLLMLAMAIAFIATIAPALGVSPPVTVTITDRLSEPDVRIEPGTTVTWINQDAERHRIRSTAGPVDIDSGNLDPGAQFVMTFDVEGTYSYQDDRNPDDTAYHGTITVSAEASTPPPPGGSSTVDIIDNSYRPANISVSSGTEVVWRNLDGNHTVTARDRSFDSGIFDAGTFRRTFNNPGSFEYFCTLHPEMVGTVTVTGSSMGEDPPPPEPPPTVPPGPAPPGDVRVVDNAFSPRSVTISTGSTLVWSNAGALPHTVTARSGAFDSGLVMPSGTYRRTFNNPGSFEYFCTLHPEMVGTVTVTGSSMGEDPPPPEPPPTVPPGPAPPGDVRVVDNAFSPRSVTISTGSTLVWSNAGALPHTVTARSGAFDSGLVMPSGTYRRTFNNPGSFEYFCTLHPEMVGTVTVTGSSMGEDPPPPEPPPTVPPGPAPPGDVRVVDNAFSPRSVTISTGSTLVWSNAGALPHTVTARSGAFDSGLVMPSGTYRRTFNNPGSFEYFCTLHPEMVGTVTVTGASTGDADADEVTDPSTAPPGTTQPPGGSGTESGAQGQGATIDALVVDLDYDPRELVVEAGTTIRWTNVGDLPHTVTDRDGAFDSDLMLTDQTYERTFDSVGAYEYFCTLHPNMVGTVTVVEAGTAGVSAGVDPGGGDTVVAAGPEISEDSGSQSAALGAMAIVAVLAIASVVAFGIGTTRSSSAGPGGQG